MKLQKVIISGGPGFGKTSIIDELERREFKCMHEVSRSIIKEQLESGGDILPWKNLNTFSRFLFERRVKQFEEAPNNGWVFFDRGIPDIIAYMGKDELEIPSSYMLKIEECNYFPMVFIVPPWKEIYKNDGERMEDYKTACDLNEIISETYANLGYETIILPKITVKERADFILKKIISLKQ
ncbi:MAG TPA: AAA family ATPase [Bacteroidia bacterium]|nr:AAA family ATPase [Bacteroidia bacterium]